MLPFTYTIKSGVVMKILVIIMLGLSFSSFAQDFCYTQGDCQKIHETTPSKQCYVVNTGTDGFGNKTCAVRCVPVELGHKCNRIEGRVFGVCLPERTPLRPEFDPNDPKRCDNSVEIRFFN